MISSKGVDCLFRRNEEIQVAEINRINRNVSKLYLKYRIAQNVRRVVSENLQRSISINEIYLSLSRTNLRQRAL